MKKTLLTMILIAGFYTITFAQVFGQTSGPVPIEFGFNVGYNASYINYGSSNFSSSALGGVNAGVSADIPFSPRWSFRARVSYDQKGWADGYLVDGLGNESDNVNYRLSYITVPLTFNYHFGYTHNWYFNFGPYVGFLMSAKETTDNVDVKQYFNSVDGGLSVGLGIKIPLNERAKFFIEYDGQAGVTNLSNDGSGNNFQNIRESINIGINF